MASLQAALTALQRLEFPFTDLPADRQDPLWTQIQQEAGLSLAQLSALKNERCKVEGSVGVSSPSTHSPPPTTTATAVVETKSSALEYTADAQREDACGETLQGYLFKTGSGLLGALYKRRFVLLSNHLIQYFADDSRNVLKGEIFLRPQSVVTKRAGDSTQSFLFDIVPLPNGRAYHFGAKDSAERDLWINAIQAAIKHCEDPRKQLCIVGGNLRRLQQKREQGGDDDIPSGPPALVSQVSSLSHGTLLIKCKGEWEEQEWRIHDGYLVFPEAGIRYGLEGASYKLIASEGPLVLGLKRNTDGLGLLLKSQRPRLKRLVAALSGHASYIGDKLSDVEDDEI